MPRKIAAGNWKMNTTYDSAENLLHELVVGIFESDVELILGVPFPFLSLAVRTTNDSNQINIAAQNVHHMVKGAYTGEVSIEMLSSMSIPYIIIGHSERREYQKESHKMLQDKINLSLHHGINPIFCCGEPLAIREAGTQEDYVRTQLEESLFHIEKAHWTDVIIAYEPIWAIGTGVTASPQQAQDMHAYIRSLIRDTYGDEIAEDATILYGGSVKPANAKELFGQHDVNGGLVGGASLKSVDFVQIANSF